MSTTICHAVEVVDEIKSNFQLMARTSQFCGHSQLSDEEMVDMMDKLCIDAFGTVAKKHQITENTVRDQCTRRLGDMTSRDFYHLVWDYLAGGTSLRAHLSKNVKDQEDEAFISHL